MLFKIYGVLQKAAKCLCYISGAALIALTLFTVVSVAARRIFNSPIMGATEITECIAALTVFTCLAYTETEKGHVNIVIILKKLPDVPAMIIYSLGYAVVAVFSCVICRSLFFQGNYAVGKNLVTSLLNIPYAPFYYAASICMLVFSVVLIVDTLIGIAGIFSQKYREETKKYWV